MVKVVQATKFTVNLLICLLLNSCNPKEITNNAANSNLLFLCGNEFTTETLNIIVNYSKLTEGGYAVIIPTSRHADDHGAEELRTRFFKNQIVAVHLLGFKEKIERSDILAIENASLICVVGEDIDDFMKFANNSKLASTLSKAFTNGANFFAVGNVSKLLGKEYISHDSDEEGSQSFKMNIGVGLINDFVIYNELEEGNYYSETFNKTSGEDNNTFLMQLNDTSCVLINNSISAEIIHGSVIITQTGKSSIELIHGKLFKKPLLGLSKKYE